MASSQQLEWPVANNITVAACFKIRVTSRRKFLAGWKKTKLKWPPKKEEMIAEAKKTITFSSLVAARSSAAVAEGTAQTAKVGFPQNIPLLIGYALQAVGIVSAITSAVSKSKSVASSLGGGGGGGSAISTPTAPASQPPSFNIVGATDTNQLADAISGQTQQPVQAFVVANDVTTAQSLENNIVEGATL